MKTKTILTGLVVLGMLVPCLLAFNCNTDTFYWDVIGLIYIWQLPRIAREVMPKWMIDYFTDDSDDNDFM